VRDPIPWVTVKLGSGVDAAWARLVREDAATLASALSPLLGAVPSMQNETWVVRLEPAGSIPDQAPRGLRDRPEWSGMVNGRRHAAWVAIVSGAPDESRRRLRHELTHVFMHVTIGGGPDFPLWLQEGLPTCFEMGVDSRGRPLDNPKRRRQLKAFLRAFLRFRPASFLGRRAGTPFSSNDCAVAWGLVYFMVTEQVMPGDRQRLVECLRAAHSAEAGGGDPTTAVRVAFETSLERAGMNVRDWERRWKKAVLRPHGWFF